jgi:hypothetical protein
MPAKVCQPYLPVVSRLFKVSLGLVIRVRSVLDVSLLIPSVSAGFRLVDVLVSVVNPVFAVVSDVVSFVVEPSPQDIKLKTTAAVTNIFFIDVILVTS